MQRPAVKHASKVLLSGSLLVWVDECKQRLSDEFLCLFFEMVGKDGVEVDELKV